MTWCTVASRASVMEGVRRNMVIVLSYLAAEVPRDILGRLGKREERRRGIVTHRLLQFVDLFRDVAKSRLQDMGACINVSVHTCQACVCTTWDREQHTEYACVRELFYYSTVVQTPVTAFLGPPCQNVTIAKRKARTGHAVEETTYKKTHIVSKKKIVSAKIPP